MNYRDYTLGDWIGHISGVIEDESELDGNEMRDLLDFLTKLPKWIPVSERLPEDGTWNIWQSKTGAISIERYKEDAYNHFYPSGRFFSLEDAVAWMPLPERYKAEEKEEW